MVLKIIFLLYSYGPEPSNWARNNTFLMFRWDILWA